MSGALAIDMPRKAVDTLLPKMTPSGMPVRYRCLYGGRDGAKSHSISRMLLARGISKKERILCVREIQNSIADSVHKLLSDLILSLNLGYFYNIQKSSIVGRNGTEFSFHGLSTETRDSLKSKEGTTICWVEEAQTISKKSWEILEPTIRADGSEIFVSFNPDMDSDEVYQKFVVNAPQDAIVTKINWDDNPWRSKVLDFAREKMRLESPDDYERVYGGKCRTAVDGAIYAGEITAAIEAKRIRPVPYDPLLKVHTIWDLGWNDRMSIGFAQRLHSEIRWIDFLENQHKTYDWYVNQIKAKGYNLGRAFLPHDGKHKNAQTGLSAEEIIRKLGLEADASENAMPVEDGIKSVRLMFHQMYFDEVKCKPLFDHLRRYRRSIPTSTNEPQGPLHDEHSHAADMVREAARRARDMTNDTNEAPIKYPEMGIV